MKRVTAILLALVLALSLLPVPQVHAQEETELPFSAYEWEVLRLVNQERLKEGLNPLTGYAALQSACDIRAVELIELFDHTRPDGTRCYTVLDEVGVSYTTAGENIAYGYRSPAAVMNGWMNSEGHRNNILKAKFGHLGVGEYSYSWVQMFTNAPAYTSIRVVAAGGTEFETGTSIDDMGLIAVLQNSNGDCYMPVDSLFCTGFDANTAGVQTVTVSTLGVSCTFTVTMVEHLHTWEEATCTVAKTCTACGETSGTALGHSWKDATCDEAKTCSVCGAADGAALGHSWADATCEEPKTCTVCDTTEGTALGHSWTDGSCEEPKICAVCDTTEGAALGHSWADATCEEPKTCTVCGETEGTALGHSWTDATCGEPKTCTVCDTTEGTALGHSWANATCTAPKTCSVCGETVGTAAGHQWTAGIGDTPAACSVCGAQAPLTYTDICQITPEAAYAAMIALKSEYPEGMRWTNDDYYSWNGGYFSGGFGCAGFAFILSDAAFGTEPARIIEEDITIEDIRVGDILRINNDTHSVIVLEVHDTYVVIAEGNYNSSIHWGRTLSAATIAATTDYIMTRYPEHEWSEGSCVDAVLCLKCGVTKEGSAGHTWLDATCSQPKTCAVCGETEGASLDHIWTDATCEKPKTCTACGKTEGETAEHTWTGGDCETPQTCSVCGAAGESAGHGWTDATCTAPKTCSVCGETEGAALDHSWTGGDCETPQTCSVCGAAGESAGHSWTDATCTAPKTCSVCGETEGAALDHSWTGGDCETPQTCSACGAAGEFAGHSWADATCTAPKTCTVCGITEGGYGHVFDDREDSECNVCGIFRLVGCVGEALSMATYSLLDVMLDLTGPDVDKVTVELLDRYMVQDGYYNVYIQEFELVFSQPGTYELAIVQEETGEELSFIAEIYEHAYENGVCSFCGKGESKGLLGDADSNGKVNNIDAMLVLQYFAGLLNESRIDLTVCDVDGNGKVNNIDAMLVLQYFAGLLAQFPAEK